jgi:hypothetical protein
VKHLSRNISIIISLALVISIFSGLGRVYAATEPSLAKSSVVLYVGGDKLDNYTASYTIATKDATGYKVSYNLTKGTSASVSAKGVVKAVKAGASTVTVTFTKSGAKTITKDLKVTVYRNAKSVKLVAKSETAIKKPLTLGNQLTLSVAKSYDGKYSKGHFNLDNTTSPVTDQVYIEALDPEIATATGLTITGIQPGVAQFRVVAYENGDKAKEPVVTSKEFSVEIVSSSAKKNAADLKALQTIINKQIAAGAFIGVSDTPDPDDPDDTAKADAREQFDDTDVYFWNSKGRLVGIAWGNSGISDPLKSAQSEATVPIDLSALTELIYIDLSDNMLTSLDLTKNKNLLYVNVSGNELTKLVVSGSPSLVGLDASNNQLAALTLTKNTKLQTLNLSSNVLTKLTLTKNVALIQLDVDDNEFSKLNLTKNVLLTPDTVSVDPGVTITGKQFVEE